jgi:hypothetical protein
MSALALRHVGQITIAYSGDDRSFSKLKAATSCLISFLERVPDDAARSMLQMTIETTQIAARLHHMRSHQTDTMATALAAACAKICLIGIK